MLKSFPGAFGTDPVDQIIPPETTIKAVLGESYHGVDQYSTREKKLFITYHKRFKLESKPAAHLNALAQLMTTNCLAKCPSPSSRLVDAVVRKA